MSSNDDTKKCDDCGNKDGSVDLLHLMCQACKDNALFEQPPQDEECPICFLTLPSLDTGWKYKPCCGKIICSGCIHAIGMMDDDVKCPFCRGALPVITDEEIMERYMKRVEVDDAEAIYNLGCCYHGGRRGLPQDLGKALELFHRAGQLGNASAYCNIGHAYIYGRGVEMDTKKAEHYWELAAMGGHVKARYNLGTLEENEDNMSRSLKHYMIAVGCGHDLSLKKMRELYVNGNASKDDYAKALRAHQKYIDGIKSPERDEAAAFDSERYRYY